MHSSRAAQLLLYTQRFFSWRVPGLTGKGVQITLDFRGHSLGDFHELPVSPKFAFFTAVTTALEAQSMIEPRLDTGDFIAIHRVGDFGNLGGNVADQRVRLVFGKRLPQ